MCVAAGKLLGVEKSLAAVGEGAWRGSPLRCYCLPWREGSWRESTSKMPTMGEGAWRGSPPKPALSRAQAQPQDLAPAVVESTPCWVVRGVAGVGTWVCRWFSGPVPPPSVLGSQHHHGGCPCPWGVGGASSWCTGLTLHPVWGHSPQRQSLSSHYLFLGWQGDWKPPFGWRDALCLLLARVLRGGVTVPAAPPEHAGISQSHWKEAE